MTRLAWTTAFLLALAGCNCGGKDNHGDGGPSTTLTGHRRLFYRLENSELSRPDPGLSGLALFVRSGSGFAERPFLGVEDGGFLVENVPQGEYLVSITSNFFIASSLRDLDLDDHNNLGRPDLDPAFNGNPVSLSVDGLTSTSTPDIVVVTPNTGFYGEASPDTLPTAPVTALSHEPASFSFTLGALPDGTAGDNTWVSQRLIRDAGLDDAGIVSYRSAERFAQVSNLALTPDGGEVTATLTAPPLSTLTANLSAADYLSHLAEVNPNATVGGFELNVFPAPSAPNLPALWAGYSGSLLDFFSGQLPQAGQPLTLLYADGYPAPWNRVLSYDVVFNVPAALPNTTGVSAAFIGDTLPLANLPNPLKPRLSPPLAFKVDGDDAFTAGNLQSLTPTLSWSAPSIGVPSGYLVGVYKLLEAGNTTRRFQAGSIATTSTQVTVPPGLISPAGKYLFRVTAQLAPGIDLAQHPLAFPTAIDLAVADVYSGIWNSN